MGKQCRYRRHNTPLAPSKINHEHLLKIREAFYCPVNPQIKESCSPDIIRNQSFQQQPLTLYQALTAPTKEYPGPTATAPFFNY